MEKVLQKCVFLDTKSLEPILQNLQHTLFVTTPSSEIHRGVPYYRNPRLFSEGKKSQLSWWRTRICTSGLTHNMTLSIDAPQQSPPKKIP